MGFDAPRSVSICRGRGSPRKQQCAAERSHHVDGAPRRMAEAERVLNARPEDTNEVCLPEARRKREDEADAQKATVLGSETHIGSDGHEVGCELIAVTGRRGQRKTFPDRGPASGHGPGIGSSQLT